MFLRRKPPLGYVLEELQQTYNDVSDTSIRNLTLEDQGQFGEALKGWKSLHTLLLYKIDSIERKNEKFSPEEAALLIDLNAIRDENLKHLVRIQLRLDEQIRKLEKHKSGDHVSPANQGTNTHKISTPSLRSANPSSKSFNSSQQQRHMVKLLRNGSSGSYQILLQNRDAVKTAATLSWTKPKAGKSTNNYIDGALPDGPQKEPNLFADFDQTELSRAQHDRLNSAGCFGSFGSISLHLELPESVNLIDLDDRLLIAASNLHTQFEDVSIGAKVKQLPPPVPPKRGAARTQAKAEEEGVSAPLPNREITPKPALKAAPEAPHKLKKYVYKQPVPLNVLKMMQQTGTRKTTKKPSGASSPTTTETSSASTNGTLRAKAKPVKKLNITYNSKPMEKAKPRISLRSADNPLAVNTTKSRPTHPSLPNLDSRINGDSSEDVSDAVTPVTVALSPEIPDNFADLTTEEQSSLIKSIKGIDEASAVQILNDIIVRGDEVHWDDIVGLDAAKNSLKEAVVYPFLRPDLFRGLREPTRGMLLFGPPGTGKTMLARAVATESKSTFFSISSLSLTSKYLGESEKLVKALFLLAKKLSPSIVFIDEIDSLLGTRNEGELESMRRIKNEFFVQWSDLSLATAGRDSVQADVSRVLILGATNLPWAIDEAARRRFAKRVYIPLPEDDTRRLQISKLLAYQNHTLLDADFAELVALTQGFSASDITLLAKDSAMGPLRSLGEKLLSTPTDEIRPIQLKDFVDSLKYIRPSVSSEGLGEYEQWAAKFGSSGA